MEAFLRYAEGHLAKCCAKRPPAPVPNFWRTGLRAMIRLIRADSTAGRTSRFRWGAANVLATWEDEEGPDED